MPYILAGITVLAAWVATSGWALAAEPRFQVATFVADITPAVGPGPCVGFMAEVGRIEHPLEARGVVLRFEGRNHVLCAVDLLGLCNGSHAFFRAQIAAAVGTEDGLVAVQSLHQHSAPCLDSDGARLLYGEDAAEFQRHEAYQRRISAAVADAAARCLPDLQPVTRIVGTRARIVQVASNRRVPQADGSLVVRGSATKDLGLQQAPEGLVDPWVRTVTLANSQGALVQLHYYATHPQTIYGDGRIGWDVPGLARSAVQHSSGVFQVYFTGCGGNVAMGKYNDASEGARAALAERLRAGLERSYRLGLGQQEPDADGARDFDFSVEDSVPLEWDLAPLQFPSRDDGEFAAPHLHAVLNEGSGPLPPRLKAAMFLAWDRRLRAGEPQQVSRLRLGPIDLVNLPGEPFVEQQLFAQQAAPKAFVCVAGYADCAVWYFGPDQIYTDRGGYEQTWAFTGPCEGRVEATLRELLGRSAP